MRIYSADMRDEVLRIVASGVPLSAAARITGVSRVTIWRWAEAARRAGGDAPVSRSGKPPVITVAEEPSLRAQAAAMPDATLAEHCARWAKEHGVRVSRPTMARALARIRSTSAS